MPLHSCCVVVVTHNCTLDHRLGTAQLNLNNENGTYDTTTIINIIFYFTLRTKLHRHTQHFFFSSSNIYLISSFCTRHTMGGHSSAVNKKTSSFIQKKKKTISLTPMHNPFSDFSGPYFNFTHCIHL